ncbi:MAG TPA: DUF503 domain-containing protein [bacterium (Candidatus Stahlbacteria)]|nr:DUF503 domain-containing protein [Candidatus Stahlbacteria bacterium]
MLIGVCLINIYIRDSCSLKDKRRILSGLKAKLRHKFNISIAEIGSKDHWQRASLGVVSVSDDGRLVESSLSKIVKFISNNPNIDVIDYDIHFH